MPEAGLMQPGPTLLESGVLYIIYQGVKSSVFPVSYTHLTIIRWETNRQILKETGFTRENDPAFEAILDAMEGGSAFEVITQYIME